MFIKSLHISHFRGVANASVDFVGYNVLVGANGAGKSTVLQALNFFFGEMQAYSESDFFNRDTSKPIEVTVTFRKLGDEEIKDFSHYVREGELRIIAQLRSTDAGKFEFRRFGERLVYPEFRPFFELPKTPATQRRDEYKRLAGLHDKLPKQSSVAAMEAALREYEESIPAENKEIARSGDEFFGISRGADKLSKYVTWVYVPAVKDAATEGEEAKNSHLGKLLQRTVRSAMNYQGEIEKISTDAREAYQKLLEGQQHHLKDLQDKLNQRLAESVTSKAGLEIQWQASDKSVTVSEPTAAVSLFDGSFQGQVANFGHGLQRAFLLSLLQELASYGAEQQPTLILGCEEPELYQHPPQARHLARVLRNLSERGAQVVLTSHSPYFVDIESVSGIKRFRRREHVECIARNLADITEEYNAHFQDVERQVDAVTAKLSTHLHPRASEIFFSDFAIFVEGSSDAAVIESYLKASGQFEKYVSLGCNVIECGGKSSLLWMILLANNFAIPYFAVFDLDGYEAHEQRKNRHEADNKVILSLLGCDADEPFPKEGLRTGIARGWPNTIEEILNEDFGAYAEQCWNFGKSKVGFIRDKKNPIFYAACVERAMQLGSQMPKIAELCGDILRAAEAARE
ncbi:AAA family ATPase [Rhodosalinus sediminis]|uniref:AAA family ATPase n=1 Tax=Rhodosalinus sediminis TaxID=1940533 RepID=UPI0023551A8C|nr:ATP-dependent endonuclease [Rhodosalinus sediminis]